MPTEVSAYVTVLHWLQFNVTTFVDMLCEHRHWLHWMQVSVSNNCDAHLFHRWTFHTITFQCFDPVGWATRKQACKNNLLS